MCGRRRGDLPIDGSTVRTTLSSSPAIHDSSATLPHVPAAEPSTRSARERRRPIDSALGKNGPGDARHFIGHGNGNLLGRHPGRQLCDPGMLFGMCPRVTDDSRCADDEDAPQVTIALLGDTAEPPLAACRMLARSPRWLWRRSRRCRARSPAVGWRRSIDVWCVWLARVARWSRPVPSVDRRVAATPAASRWVTRVSSFCRSPSPEQP